MPGQHFRVSRPGLDVQLGDRLRSFSSFHRPAMPRMPRDNRRRRKSQLSLGERVPVLSRRVY